MIIHSVIFKLKYSKDSVKEKDFLNAAMQLVSIPAVQNLRSFRQTSQKNKFEYGLTMVFETTQDYDAYTNHLDHMAFIQNFWIQGVNDFLEIDYEPLEI